MRVVHRPNTGEYVEARRRSRYHDATGDAAKNAELAKQRAQAVRDLLVAAGVAQEKIELQKPGQAKAEGSEAEARRVEVTLQ